MKITTIVRTHRRPRRLERCLRSIAGCYDKVLQLIVVSDEPSDPVEEIVESIEWKQLDWIRFRPEPMPWPPNDYFNQVRPLIDGEYVTYIDDDDRVMDPDYYSCVREAGRKASPSLIIWRANLGRLYRPDVDTIVPENSWWRRRPKRGQFSTLTMAVRTSVAHAVPWRQGKGGDHLFGKAVWDQYVEKDPGQVVFVDRILAATQNSLSTHGSFSTHCDSRK